MAITEKVIHGQKTFVVYVNLRSRSNPALRVQQRVKGVKSLHAAHLEEKKLHRILAERLARLEGKGLTWQDVLYAWERYHKNPLTSEHTQGVLYDYMLSVYKWTTPWLKKHVTELGRPEGKELFTAMALDGRRITYQHKVKRIIQNIFDWAIEERIIDPQESPIKHIKFKKAEEKLPEILGLAEIKKFLFEAKRTEHPWYPVWAMALLTGMRSGELHALAWDAVDFESGLLYVHQNFCTREQKVGPTKGRYWRTVPMSPQLENFLKELKLKTGGKGLVLPRFKAWDSGHQAQEIRPFCESIGVSSIGFHTLRACFATHLLGQGQPTSKIMKIGGWKDLKTMERYIRMAGVEVKGATDGLDFLPDPKLVSGEVLNFLKLVD